jgi:hypothetical protein
VRLPELLGIQAAGGDRLSVSELDELVSLLQLLIAGDASPEARRA